MSSITADLAALLAAVRRPGDFFVSGTVEMMAPQIEVDGVGPIALPLLPVQAEQLVTVAEAAPYGRGEETLVDAAVRRTWQIPADQVRIRGKHWAGTLEAILAQVADGLGLTEAVSAELYKMLVYDRGSFFVGHRDTEKAPGMFATLVVVLPSLYAGGELIVRHKGREVLLDLRCDEPSEVRFAAFYADCVHEVQPVTDGCRLTLIYNLVRPGRGKGRLPKPPDYESEQDRAAALLQDWVTGWSADGSPKKLIYPLEHAYTQAEIGFSMLKGADAAVAGVLTAAAPRADCDLYLALLSIEESGTAEYQGHYGRRRYQPDDDEFEIGEVYERNVSLTNWCHPDGGSAVMAALPVKDDELSPSDALEDLEPDEVNFHEATGNAGASFERAYRRASLVLWPRVGFLAVLNQAGLSAALPYLTDLVDRWSAAGIDCEAPEWRQAYELAGHVVSDWPTRPWFSTGATRGPSDTTRVLDALIRLGDSGRIAELLAKVAACNGFSRDDAAVLTEALARLDRDLALVLLESLCVGSAASALGAGANLLVRSVAASALNPASGLTAAALRLVEALPGAPPQNAVTYDPRVRPTEVDYSLVVDLLTALTAIDEALASRAVDHMLAWPKVWGLDAVLVPAIAALIASPAKLMGVSPALQRLLHAGLAHLRARIAEPLVPPTDWRRESAVRCSCRDCVELVRFLSDADRPRWEFRAAEARRRHVEGSIASAKSDVHTSTVRNGSPHGLVCIKNQASYERRVQQLQQDLADLARLER